MSMHVARPSTLSIALALNPHSVAVLPSFFRAHSPPSLPTASVCVSAFTSASAANVDDDDQGDEEELMRRAREAIRSLSVLKKDAHSAAQVF